MKLKLILSLSFLLLEAASGSENRRLSKSKKAKKGSKSSQLDDLLSSACDPFTQITSIASGASVTLGSANKTKYAAIKTFTISGTSAPQALIDISRNVLGCGATSDKRSNQALRTIETCFDLCDDVGASYPCGGVDITELCLQPSSTTDIVAGVFWEIFMDSNATLAVDGIAAIDTLVCTTKFVDNSNCVFV